MLLSIKKKEGRRSSCKYKETVSRDSLLFAMVGKEYTNGYSD
jgi:hypothetical protein